MPGPASAPPIVLRTVAATRYVTPLREGGSLPGLVEADDDGLYVVKFRGAGQGAKALAAEVIAGELARALGLPVPELVLVEIDPALGRAEPDPEIQDLIEASPGLNVGLDFLPGALPYSPAVECAPDPELAAAVVWFDALVTNVDRTARNPNLLLWHGRLWLIDHGAALYAHHAGLRPEEQARRPFPQVAQHVLLPCAGSVAEADERLAPVARAALAGVVALVPEAWLGDERPETYVDYLARRLEAPRPFVEEAEHARRAAAA
jgi:hypothetical protein